MIAEILAVGTELLMGQIANTNAQYISRRLPDAGIGVYYHSVVGDNPDRLAKGLELALDRSDIVIMTGGLGPTQDDLTKQTVAKKLGRALILDEVSLARIKNFFKDVNRPMTENNIRQAYFPENSLILTNGNGTAPGCLIEDNGKVIIMLPGPPSEMKPMFEEWVIPYFEKKMDFKLVSKFIKIFGVGESAMETQIMDLIENQTNPTIAPYAKEGEVTLRITAKCGVNETGEEILNPTVNEITKRMGDAVYSTEDKSIDEVAAELLINNNVTISLAESCTGGLIAQRLTSISGVSAVFNRGYVTYSNEAKIQDLNVNEDLLNKYGAVSQEVAEAMAIGTLQSSKTTIALSVTGIAGPDGGTPEKPVGTVFIAIADENNVECKKLNLWGSRERIRNVAALNAFDMIRRWVIKNKKS